MTPVVSSSSEVLAADQPSRTRDGDLESRGATPPPGITPPQLTSSPKDPSVKLVDLEKQIKLLTQTIEQLKTDRSNLQQPDSNLQTNYKCKSAFVESHVQCTGSIYIDRNDVFTGSAYNDRNGAFETNCNNNEHAHSNAFRSKEYYPETHKLNKLLLPNNSQYKLTEGFECGCNLHFDALRKPTDA